MRWHLPGLVLALMIAGCATRGSVPVRSPTAPFVVVLGVAQDGGYPQTACRRGCCEDAWGDPGLRRRVACLGIVDPVSGERWMIDATPDFREQVRMLDSIAPRRASESQAELAGIFLTHAHIGHYTGLMDLGREVTGARDAVVYAMPRMKGFLETNGPWSLLVSGGYIALRELHGDEAVRLNDRLRVTPVLVPHRGEFSETVGFRIEGASKSVLYIPDIDKWELWDRAIEDEIRKVDVAYLDGTFFRNGEIAGRDMSLIPHPFIEESMKRFGTLPEAERAKIRFIHLNHTNPVIRNADGAADEVRTAGYGVALEGERTALGDAGGIARETQVFR